MTASFCDSDKSSKTQNNSHQPLTWLSQSVRKYIQKIPYLKQTSNRSWSITDRDLLVSDLSFFNQTLMFALRENDEVRGLNMIRLIENLMTPSSLLLDENKRWIEDGAEVLHVDVHCVSNSKMLTNVMVIVGNISYLIFFATGIFVVLSLLVTVYCKIYMIWYCR